MKICILAVCLFGLALAAPGGDRDGDREGGKGGKGGKGPIGGLVKLCMSLAEDAAEKREFDYESALVEICAFLLEQKPEDATKPTQERSYWEYARAGDKGPRPTGEPQEGGEGKKGGKKGPRPTGEPQEGGEGKQGGDRQGAGGDGKGPKPTGSPSERSFWERARGGKGGDKQGKGGDRQGPAGQGEGEEKELVDVLLRICKGLAEMAEKADQEARAIETKEDLMEAMKVVCDAAKAEADARDSTTPSM